MDQAGKRALIQQIAEDLAWLEQHARSQPDEARHAGALRLAAALVRNVIGPFLEDQPAAPLHIAVVGGAGAGKSTVANFLIGAIEAESNPQAGFTRHPVAYAKTDGQLAWPAQVGFLGAMQRLAQPESASLDQDVYQVRRLSPGPEVIHLLDRFVVWDCPDMTTWAATNYVPRLLEVAALADVVVYVASDERYNDAVPTEYLKLLLQAGKAIVVCLVKMKETQVPALVQHFQQVVLAHLPGKAVACLAIPNLTREQLADPVRLAGPWRIPLVNQLNVLGEPATLARRRTVRSAMAFLKSGERVLLGVARQDLEALASWRRVVHEGQSEFDSRYRREFLSTDRLLRFDEALVKLLDLLELPGAGKYLSGALHVIKTPYRWLRGAFNKALQRPQAPPLMERPVLASAMGGWIDLLRKEAARHASREPLWQHINQGFASGLANQIKDRFEESLARFHSSINDEVDRTARGIYEHLLQNPVALNTLRSAKFTLEIGAIVGTVAGTVAAVHTAGMSLFWLNLVLVPLAASVTSHLIEVLGQKYVDTQREQARARQQALVTQHLSGPLAEWLIQWPSTGGSAYERLQLVLRRLPENIGKLDADVNAALTR
jgi:hypothetical protein